MRANDSILPRLSTRTQFEDESLRYEASGQLRSTARILNRSKIRHNLDPVDFSTDKNNYEIRSPLIKYPLSSEIEHDTVLTDEKHHKSFVQEFPVIQPTDDATSIKHFLDKKFLRIEVPDYYIFRHKNQLFMEYAKFV